MNSSASSFGILFRDISPSKKTKSVRNLMDSAPVYRLGEIAKVVSQSIGTVSMRYGDLSDDEEDDVQQSFEVTLPLKMIRDLLFWDKRDAVLYSCAAVFMVFVRTSTSSTYGWLPLAALFVCFLGTSSHGVRAVRDVMSGTPSESRDEDEMIPVADQAVVATPLESMDQTEVTTWLKRDLGLSGVAERLESLGKNMKCDIDGALLTEVDEEKDLEELVGTDTPRLVRKKLLSALRDVRSGNRQIVSRRRRLLSKRVEEINSEEIKEEEVMKKSQDIEEEEVKKSKEIEEEEVMKSKSKEIKKEMKDMVEEEMRTPLKTSPSTFVAPTKTSSCNDNLTSSSNKNSNQQDEKIAIVGYSCILPGGKNVGESWDVIRNKIDCITDIPKDRVDVTAYFHPEKRTKDKIYCKKGGFIPDFEFDALEYNLNMLQLEDTDMNQILSLVKVKEALIDAELETKEKRKGSKIGCVLGIGGGQKASHEFFSRLNYVVVDKVLRKMGMSDQDVKAAVEKYKAHFPEWRIDSFPGFLGNVTAGRITNVFDLDGMNCVVDAACASSLVALKVAIDEILHGDCDTMIAGATCTFSVASNRTNTHTHTHTHTGTDCSLGMFMSFSKTPVFSTKPGVTAYDKDTGGMLIGEGSVMFVLKRLSQAVKDGDTIHAVVGGCASSSDGKASGIYAPTISGQEKAIRRALEKAGKIPEDISMVEGHGTGT